MAKVLLIQDSHGIGEPMKTLLMRRGHEVTWVLGANEVAPDQLTAIASDWSDVTVTPSEHEVAIVDGRLAGKFHGAQIIPALVEAGVICIADSSTDNDRLYNAGATRFPFEPFEDALDRVPKALALRG